MNGEKSHTVNKPILIIVFSLVLGFLFNYFFVWKIPGIGVGVFTTLITCSMIALASLCKQRLPRDVVLLLFLAIFFSAMVAVRANILLTVLNILATALLLLLVSEVNVRGTIRGFAPFDFVKMAWLPIPYLIALIDTISSVRLPFLKPTGNQSKQIIRGILLTAPVIALFVALFAGADPVFHRVLSAVFNLYFPSPEHPVVILMVFAALCGAFGYSFSGTSSIQHIVLPLKRPMGHIETAILLGSVNVLFIIFIALQATYLFGGVVNITHDVFTYAEYARRGFFELIAVSVFSLSLMLAVEKLIERNTVHHSKAFKYLSVALIVQVMILMVFAFSRLSLYEAAFGFTTLRLYSHACIVLLAAVYLFLLYKILVDTRESGFALRTFFAVVVFLAGMNALNPDAFIAQKNLERFNATGKIDYEYLAELSSDATPMLLTIFEKGDPVERAPLGRALSERASTTPNAWQSWNKSRAGEASLLSDYRVVLESYRN